MHDELSGHGFAIVAVALDESPDDVRPWAEGVTFPVLVDREHQVAERFGIINVPTVVWIDEAGRIVRPHDAQFPDDKFVAFHGIDPAPHLEALRRWVREGEAPMTPEEARSRTRLPADDEQRARLHRRVAVHLRRAGREGAAEQHFQRAIELTPLDWTIRRGSMPLRGLDPFGAPMADLIRDWEAAGRPGYPRKGAAQTG